jgi:DNA repair protein RecO (recombination protein O)
MSSKILKDRGIILRTYQYGESSLVVVMLTSCYGKVRMLAKGARKMKSPFAGSMLTGSLGDVVFYFREGRGMQTLTEINIIRRWSGNQNDLDKICLFQAGLEVVDHSVVGEESDRQIFELMEEYIEKLSMTKNLWFCFYAMEVKLLMMLGHFPSLERCSRCGRELREESKVVPSSGEVLCEECDEGGAVQLSRDSFGYLRVMSKENFGDIESVSLNSTTRREIGRVLHYLFLHHVQGYTLPHSLRILKGANRQ